MTARDQPFRPGELIRVRDERWRVIRHQPHVECAVLDVSGVDETNRGTTARYLLPFDRPERPTPSDRPRIVRATALRRVLKDTLQSATPAWTSLRSPATARISLLPFQLEPALAIIRGHATRVLIADAVGLGKTIQAGLVVAEVLAREPDARILIVTPAGLRDQWREELAERFHIECTLVDAAGIMRTSAQVPSDINPWSLPRTVITSIDFVKRPDVMRSLEGLVWDVIVFDEAHGLAGHSDRSAAARLLAERGRRVLLLTATPHPGDDDAFARLCGLGALDGDEHALVMFRRGRGAIGALVSRRSRLMGVTPTSAEREMFDALHRYARAVRRHALPQHAAGARLAMGILARRACSCPASLAQSVERRLALLAGHIPPGPAQLQLPLDDSDLDREPGLELAVPGLPDDGQERATLMRILTLAQKADEGGSKVRALRRFLRRCRQPVIVFTEYRDTLARVAESLGLGNTAVLHGGLDAPERRRQLRRFTHGDADLLLATDAASEGLNLHHRCRIAINLEAPWTPTRFEQRAGRIDRLGQKGRPHIVTLASKGTFEDRVIARLVRRQASVEAAAPFDRVPEPARSPNVTALDLTSAAEAEAMRLRRLIAMGPRQELHTRGAFRARPPAAILGRSTPRALYWALALHFVDDEGALVWRAVIGLHALLRFDCERSRRKAEAVLLGATVDAAPSLMRLALQAHATHLAQLTTDIRDATSILVTRDRAVEAVIRLQQARLALSLLQHGLFDRRPSAAAAPLWRGTSVSQGAAPNPQEDGALVDVREHLADLDRLRHPREGERTLLFLAATSA
jgi:superfamily II DNA or RNA helicase